MKNLINLTVTLLLLCSSPCIGQSKPPEGTLPREIRETSVTVCWIECPLRRVLSDLECVKPDILDVDSTVSPTDLDTLITLEIIDVSFEQVLTEILSPIGLTYEVKDGAVIVSQSSIPNEKKSKSRGFIAKWKEFNQISPPPVMLLPNKAQKRHGWIYLGGRMEETKDSLEFTRNKKLHRWISSRPKITVTKRFIQNKESQLQSRVRYRSIPVVELVSKSDKLPEQ